MHFPRQGATCCSVKQKPYTDTSCHLFNFLPLHLIYSSLSSGLLLFRQWDPAEVRESLLRQGLTQRVKPKTSNQTHECNLDVNELHTACFMFWFCLPHRNIIPSTKDLGASASPPLQNTMSLTSQCSLPCICVVRSC